MSLYIFAFIEFPFFITIVSQNIVNSPIIYIESPITNIRSPHFCSQFVSEVLQKSGALELPKPSTLMHPSDYAELPELRCLYRGTLAGLPQRQSMELGEVESVMGLYLNVLLGAVKGRVRRLF